ncbi:hypothetical protein JW707_03765 [Candidatus Woesearchaeota archaeon]|nr:hypothetical protein [Candidatus Woesearchaeota archaeon]
MKKEGKPAIKKFVRENKVVIIFFALSTLFFLYQRYVSFSWDFTVYVSNAKYWFANGQYFEPLRPPLMPFILSILSVFGWTASQYIYIILISALFAYSSIRLADSLKLNRTVFYLLSLNPYVLKLGLVNGTELLSLAFFELFAASLISKKDSGYWLGLACLSRYNLVIFLPALIFHKNIKKIIKNGIYFALPFIPWFAYNYLKFGNIFMSIADIYANNVKFRGYIHQSFNFGHVGMVINFMLPFFFLGIIYASYLVVAGFYSNRSLKGFFSVIFEKNIGEIIMLVSFAAFLNGYNSIPIKDVRYLFTLSMPVVYFSALGIEYLSKKSKMPKLKFIITAALVLLAIASVPPLLEYYETKEVYADSIEKMEELGINNCALKSNGWVLLNYLGRTSHDYPWDMLVSHYIDKGYYILLFYRIGEPIYSRNATFMHQFPVAYENEDYIILGNATSEDCAPITKVDNTYVAAVNQTVTLLYNTSIDTDACHIMFEGNIPRRFCNLVNLRWQN